VESPSSKLLAGRYRVLRRLGSGGMATVLLAEDERLGRQVAIKRMHAESPDEAAKRFRREAHLGASLNHPNIVSVFDIEADDENVLIVMEHVPGGTLKDALARGPLPREAALKVLSGVAAGLDYAHEHGVVHRDVKPANVLLDNEGRPKLADLGIATAAEVTHITRTGTVMGTAPYMAPERLEGHAGGPAADVYALATVAYEALTGHKARQGRSAVEIAHAVMGEPPPDLRVHLPDAPAAAADVLARGMARDAAERPASAGALVRELSDALGGAAPQDQTAATTALPPSAPVAAARSRRPLLAVLAAVAAIAAVVAALALAGGDDGKGSAGTAAGAPRPATTDTSAPTTTTEAPAPAPAPEPDTATSPEATVEDFYARAAGDDFDGAWALAGDGLRSQLGGYDSFVATLGSLQSIEFPKLTSISRAGDTATVELQSVATHADRVDRCSGTAQLSADGDGWLIERLDVNCDPQPGDATPPSGKGPDGGRPIPGEGKRKKWKDRQNQGGWGQDREDEGD
jgi:hypothetical protein